MNAWGDPPIQSWQGGRAGINQAIRQPGGRAKKRAEGIGRDRWVNKGGEVVLLLVIGGVVGVNSCLLVLFLLHSAPFQRPEVSADKPAFVVSPAS